MHRGHTLEAVVTHDVLVESSGGFQIVDITVCVTTLVSELPLGASRGHTMVDVGVVADRALLPLLILVLRDLDRDRPPRQSGMSCCPVPEY